MIFISRDVIESDEDVYTDTSSTNETEENYNADMIENNVEGEIIEDLVIAKWCEEWAYDRKRNDLFRWQNIFLWHKISPHDSFIMSNHNKAHGLECDVQNIVLLGLGLRWTLK